MTFGLDGSRDEADRFCRRRKLETQSLGEILPAFRTPHKVDQQALATGPQRFRRQHKRPVIRTLLCHLVDSPAMPPFIFDPDRVDREPRATNEREDHPMSVAAPPESRVRSSRRRQISATGVPTAGLSQGAGGRRFLLRLRDPPVASRCPEKKTGSVTSGYLNRRSGPLGEVTAVSVLGPTPNSAAQSYRTVTISLIACHQTRASPERPGGHEASLRTLAVSMRF